MDIFNMPCHEDNVQEDSFNLPGENMGCRSMYAEYDPNDERCCISIPAAMDMYVFYIVVIPKLNLLKFLFCSIFIFEVKVPPEIIVNPPLDYNLYN
jgi:hypothetical protein